MGDPSSPYNPPDQTRSTFEESIQQFQPQAAPPESAEWYVIHGGAESGPFSLGELAEQAISGKLCGEDLVKPAGGLWTKACEIPFLQIEFRQRESRAQEVDNLGRFHGIWISKDVLLRVIAGGMILGLAVIFAAWIGRKPGNVPDGGIQRKDAAFYFKRGLSYMDKKEYDNAIKDFDEVIRINPNDAGAFNNRGNGRLNKKEYDNAIKDYDQALRLEPKFELAFFNRGHTWIKKGDFNKAIADLDEAILLDPKHTLAYVNRGYAWHSVRDYENALKDYDKAIKLDPTHTPAIENRRFVLADIMEQDRLGRERKANEWLLADMGRVETNNRAIFLAVQKFVDAHPKVDPRDVFLSNIQWEQATRPFRTKTTLSRFELEHLLDFLGRAVKHVPYSSDPSFPVIIGELKRWDFTYSR